MRDTSVCAAGGLGEAPGGLQAPGYTSSIHSQSGYTNKLPAQSFTSDLVEDNLVLRFLQLPSQQSSTDDGVQPMVTTLDDLSSCSAIIRRMKLLFQFFSF